MAKVSVAPMLDWTDRHCRYFLRGFSPRTLLYTEMITAAALQYGPRQRLLEFSPEEQPLALQLGGSDPAQLAAAAALGAAAGYREINLNCGCPSERVQSGSFGACLMLEPTLVADCIRAMAEVCDLPVTLKLRIGVVSRRAAVPGSVQDFDEADYQRLADFVATVAAAGCQVFIVHARKAVLEGLSPRENREVPPLRYDVVQRLKQEFPRLAVILNGGLRTVQQVEAALGWCDGVMLGREAYHRPRLLDELHQRLFADGWQAPDDAALIERMAGYAEQQLARGERLAAITRHLLGLCNGRDGARHWRRMLSEGARDPAAGPQLLRDAARYLVMAV
ncbi:MAG: tRNA dihydrouridine(20/20a) synthase DusA [Steroidobacteraceae bacterium]